MSEQLPVQKTPEQQEETLLSMELAATCAAQARELMRALPSRSESDREGLRGLEKMAYHTVEHPDDVVRRTRKILDVCKNAGIPVSHTEERLALLAGMFHDVVQHFDVDIQKDPEYPEFEKSIRSRKKYSGINEKESADVAVSFITETYPDVLTAENEAILRSAVQATQVYFDMVEGTLVSTTADKDTTSPLLQHVLSFADLGAAGMDGPHKFVAEGNALFREEQFDIQNAIYAMRENPPTALSERQKEFFQKRMLMWTKDQITFAERRRIDTERELEHLVELVPDGVPDIRATARQKLQEVLEPGFEESIVKAQQKFQERQKMTFEELAADFGYELAAK